MESRKKCSCLGWIRLCFFGIADASFILNLVLLIRDYDGEAVYIGFLATIALYIVALIAASCLLGVASMKGKVSRRLSVLCPIMPLLMALHVHPMIIALCKPFKSLKELAFFFTHIIDFIFLNLPLATTHFVILFTTDLEADTLAITVTIFNLLASIGNFLFINYFFCCIDFSAIFEHLDKGEACHDTFELDEFAFGFDFHAPKFSFVNMNKMLLLALGVADVVTDIMYYLEGNFANEHIERAILAFIIIPFFVFCFVTWEYVTHIDLTCSTGLWSYLVLFPCIAILFETKIIGFMQLVTVHAAKHKKFIWFALLLIPCFFESIPMIIIQAINNSDVGWSSTAESSFICSVICAVDDLGFVYYYISRDKSPAPDFGEEDA